jgi:hypothetical protein
LKGPYRRVKRVIPVFAQTEVLYSVPLTQTLTITSTEAANMMTQRIGMVPLRPSAKRTYDRHYSVIELQIDVVAAHSVARLVGRSCLMQL